jgi:hypothetical protein
MLDFLSGRWKGLLTVFLVAGFGLAIHTAPMTPQSPCEPGVFAKVQATIIPSAKATDGCQGYCETAAPGCMGGIERCDVGGCYDGGWTYCYDVSMEPPPAE